MRASKNTSRIAVYLPDDLKELLDQFKSERNLSSDSGAVTTILWERLGAQFKSEPVKEQIQDAIAALSKLL